MAKEKKEKVVIRKCHYCKKPLDEGKDFCLHCGHTYTEEDPFAQAKKDKKKRFWKKLAIKLGIALGIALVIAVAVIFIVKEINKSDYSRIVLFIREEGEFVEGPPAEEDEETEDEESSSEGSSAESSEGDEESTEEEEIERRMVLPEAYNRYVYEMEQDFYLVALEDATTSFYIIYETEVDGLYNKIIIEITEDNKEEYLWESFITYVGDNVVDSRYDFDYSYHGSFDPSDFVTKTQEGDIPWSVEIVSQIKEEVEVPEDEEATEGDEDEESSSEEEEESSSDEEISDDEILDEDEEPQISPEQARENAMVNSVTETVRFMIHYLAKCIEENGIGATFDELGFTKYFNYLEALDPMNDPFANLNI